MNHASKPKGIPNPFCKETNPKQAFPCNSKPPTLANQSVISEAWELFTGNGIACVLAADPSAANFDATVFRSAPPNPASAHIAVPTGVSVPMFTPSRVTMLPPLGVAVVAKRISVNDAPVDGRSGRYGCAIAPMPVPHRVSPQVGSVILPVAVTSRSPEEKLPSVKITVWLIADADKWKRGGSCSRDLIQKTSEKNCA